MNFDNRQPTELTAAACILWSKFTAQQKAVVRFGMIPVEAASELEKHGFKARDITLAFFDCAKADGGMRA